MLRSLLNSEITNTNGAINPCHSPSQNPAMEAFAPGVAFTRLGPGAQPANIASNSKTRISAANFITGPPTSCCVPRGTSHGQTRLSLRDCRAHRLAAIRAAHEVRTDGASAMATKWSESMTTFLTIGKIRCHRRATLRTWQQQWFAQKKIGEEAQRFRHENHQQ